MVEGFKHALPDMQQFSGFLGLELWEAADGTMQAVSRWASKEALDEYTNNQVFRQHHGGPGGGARPSSPPQVAYYNCEVIS
jgi:heme-degrading monooxygenase HmoA